MKTARAEARSAKAAERKARQESLDRAYAEADRIVAGHKCPRCGSGLRRNSALAGWWQCEQYGSGHFRARPQDKECDFQCFTSDARRAP